MLIFIVVLIIPLILLHLRLRLKIIVILQLRLQIIHSWFIIHPLHQRFLNGVLNLLRNVDNHKGAQSQTCQSDPYGGKHSQIDDILCLRIGVLPDVKIFRTYCCCILSLGSAVDRRTGGH